MLVILRLSEDVSDLDVAITTKILNRPDPAKRNCAMASTVRESSHVSRKIVSHGGGHGQIHHNHSSTTASNLENNLDALLEDLQTSVSRSATPVRGGRALSPQVEYRAPANTTRIVSEGRTISPTRSTTTTTEKYVTTGNSGAVSGIPGLEILDAELQNVQPGQSKTVAYKQVSYQYKTNLDGSPRDGDSWAMSENVLNATGPPMIEEIRDRSYTEESHPTRRHRSPDPPGKTSTVNRELLFDTSSTSRSRQTSPLPASQQRDVSYVQESSSYHVDPRPVQSTVTTIRKNQTLKAPQEVENIEYIPVPSPNAAVPINLAPGPNTKVTTTVKTYTYELPGSPENYIHGSTLPRGVVLPGDQTITYTLPRGGSNDKSYTIHTQKVTNSTLPGQTVTYQVPSPDGPGTQIRYASPPPPETTTKTSSLHKEAKYYHEEQRGFPPGSPVQKPVNNTIVYHTGPPPSNNETVTTVTKNEKYYQVNGTYPNGDGPRSPNSGPHGPGYGPDTDRPDHGTNTTTIIYQNQPAPKTESHTTTTINRSQEYYEGRPYPNEPAHKYPGPDHQRPEGPSHTTVNYYTVAPPQTNPPQPTNTTIYKYSNTTTTIPPNKYPDDHEVLLPKPFPTSGVQLYPANAKPQTPSNGHGPPDKLEDLMASFSDTERVVLADISNKERDQQKLQKSSDPSNPKKDVDFVPHTPPKVQSKNYAGPPVYYPPGSAEFTKKEESGGAMMQSSGGWQKGKAKYEYEASSKSKSKSSSGGAVVPVCLPLCCAMPCVIM
ncbi:mucin-2 isoform X1 [Neodiprion pinetum]|uniref:mucin-2 isoform X1 n=2 Tax=Neodiprion pinetum TaxID=441929 RepID=UPI001EDE3AD2|nr:mucin-12 isoform X1 [Neodiprion pinetum]